MPAPEPTPTDDAPGADTTALEQAAAAVARSVDGTMLRPWPVTAERLRTQGHPEPVDGAALAALIDAAHAHGLLPD